ncbi:speedy protein A [Echeneis naucrates]|uniref:speedy protein A n=1 Tax=Echeneis naucrates TaxID=173247 RepID=UPI001114242E|nr:speedy protein A [Echeneis naucrates]
MKHTRTWCQTPPSATLRHKPSSTQTAQSRRGLRLKRAKVQDTQGPPGKRLQNQHQDEVHRTKMATPPTIVIQLQEMSSYFRLFDDDLIHDFLWMDCCRKMTDKYLLAMTFVYFKRAHFTIAEYTRRNFFIALYLANTMEEDEEESKYEIFPWALGENWQKRFPRFLKQRDKLWGRIQYRAAVSRRCCEEVMAIVPSHSVWLRERSEHHSGARRHYGNRDDVNIPRGPSASPVYCALCNCSGRLRQGLGSSSPCKGFSVQTQNNTYPDPFPSFQTTETTPPRDRALYRKRVGTKSPMQYSSCCCTEEVLRDESSCGSAYDTSMDWISEE